MVGSCVVLHGLTNEPHLNLLVGSVVQCGPVSAGIQLDVGYMVVVSRACLADEVFGLPFDDYAEADSNFVTVSARPA